MIIQSNYGAFAYSGIASQSGQRQDSSLAPTGAADPAKTADQISLSSASKALAASKGNFTQPRTPAQEDTIRAASSDRESGEKIAYGMAYTSSAIVWDITGQGGVGDGTGEFVRRLATTGEIVDDNYINQFNSSALEIDAQRRAIYETEKAKGTDPVQIISMMIDLTNSQSQDYLEATGWAAGYF